MGARQMTAEGVSHGAPLGEGWTCLQWEASVCGHHTPGVGFLQPWVIKMPQRWRGSGVTDAQCGANAATRGEDTAMEGARGPHSLSAPFLGWEILPRKPGCHQKAQGRPRDSLEPGPHLPLPRWPEHLLSGMSSSWPLLRPQALADLLLLLFSSLPCLNS